MNIGLLLFIPHRHLENRVLDTISAAGFDVTIAQARLLQRIAANGSRLTELAEAAQVTKQTAGFLVDQLEKSGWVERVPDPTDGRARLVCLTDKAKAAAPIADGEVARVEAEWEKHVGKRRMAQLRETLEKLCEITDPYR
ncbi:MarR family winged helix-turn-helix transcriptional regulator [Amycolatopsis alkalitolerans]|uniref:MarR family transcriptional regulator n=1 Tax=Amycolatopsis alkalitolerans TaxID=2547244 RepID=A0A5C4M7F6_9PSEU|nr:MarR family transcriptional regulator [Amycolatopsis alkalitolerans]TNC28446.1 MarR family transcriptional regulator [Amycolatopsis alkalitolerans]